MKKSGLKLNRYFFVEYWINMTIEVEPISLLNENNFSWSWRKMCIVKYGTWKSCSFSCWKAIWAITDPMKIHFFVSDYCFLVLRVGHLHSFRSPTVGHLYALVGPAVGHLPQFWNQKTNAQWMIKVIRDTALNTGNMGISKQGQATRSWC